ncbi:MFS transporter [Actinophytocola sp.]|uniref:MFS transporter n=1 Tax=Actinophytocola sp. TaxID=1872138 RepID=UPI002ED7EA43
MRRYRELLGVPGVLRLTLAVLLSRVTTSMLNLTLLVAVTQSYGYAEAGLVLMVFAVSTAVVGPARGRLADRREPRRVLLTLLAGHMVAYTGLLAGLAATAPVEVLFLAAAVLGVTVPPAGPVVRGVWPSLVAADRLPTAYAFDAALNNATFVSGPMIAGGLLLVLPPAGAMAITGAMKLAGDALVALAPAIRRVGEPTEARQHARQHGAARMFGPLVDGRIRLLLAMIALDTFAFGCLEVTAVAAASGQGSAGVFTSLLALGGVVSGIAYGARTWPGGPRAQLIVLHTGAALALLAGAAAGPAGAGLVAVGAAFTLFGLLSGPVETLQQVLVGDLSPPGQRIEAFAWVFSIMWAGFGVGTTIAGQLAGPGTTAPTLLVGAGAQAAIVALAAVNVAGLRRSAT